MPNCVAKFQDHKGPTDLSRPPAFGEDPLLAGESEIGMEDLL